MDGVSALQRRSQRGVPVNHQAAQDSNPSFAGFRRALYVVVSVAVVFVVVWRWPLGNPLAGASRYAPFHIALETVSIALAMLVFAITWNAYRAERVRNVLIIGCGLGAAGVMDFVHTLSFAGMPDFVTPAGPEKAINFWLAARLLTALTLVVAAVLPWRPLVYPRTRWLVLGSCFLVVAVVVWAGLFHQQWWPRTFVDGAGLTPFKIGAEYAIVAVLAVACAVFFTRARRTGDSVQTYLFAATAISVMSELAFTLYSDVTDMFNLTGHVYKVIAFGYLYRAVFVSSVHQPFERAIAAEASTRQATRRLEALLANLPSAVVVHQADSSVSYANPAALELLGLTHEQALDKTVDDDTWHFIREDGSAMPVAEFPASQVLARGGPITGLVAGVVRHEGDEPRWVLANGFAETEEGGVVSGGIVSFVDVTERKHAEDSLRHLNRELRAMTLCDEALVRASVEQTLLDSICGIICDVAGYQLVWVGYPEQDEACTVRIVAQAGVDEGYLDGAHITWADVPRGRGPAGTAIRTGTAMVVDDFAADAAVSPWRDAAIERGYRSALSLPLKDTRGVTFGVLVIYSAEVAAFTSEECRLLQELATDLGFGIGVLRDRQAHDALELQLRQAQKMEIVGHLAGGIAHDFNNVLAAIRGYGELLRADFPADGQGRGDLDEMLAAASRAELLVRQLLAFARRQVVAPTVLRPADIASRFAPMLRRVLGEHVELVLALPLGSGDALIDPAQLEQVILNLAVNARDAMPDGGRLEIGVADVDLGPTVAAGAPSGAAPGPHVAITVSDTGSGMSDATKAHLFEPFFTTKSEGRGTGLGLATVAGIVHGSGGHITVDSELGRGTTFRVLLPRVAPGDHRVEAPRGDDETVLLGSETVLVVEDDSAVRRYAARVLEGFGYTVLEAASGADAIGLASGHDGPVNLLLTDVAMPSMQGPEVARRLRALVPGIAVVFMSGFSSGPDDEGGPFVGATRLAKPFSPEDLGRAVRAAIDAGVAAGR